MTNLHVLPDSKPKHEVKIDLDERAFLFPAGKPVIQLVLLTEGRKIHFEAAFPFNQSRTPPRIATLDLDDARDLAHKLVEVVHTAKSQLLISEGTHVTINVVANGYRLQFGDVNKPVELFISTGAIWRVCHGLLRAVDFIAPIESN
jgi:hypothetical protein